MDTLTFISEIVSALVWPITVVICLLLLKKPLTNILNDRIKEFKGFGIEAKFSEKAMNMVIDDLTGKTELINSKVVKSSGKTSSSRRKTDKIDESHIHDKKSSTAQPSTISDLDGDQFKEALAEAIKSLPDDYSLIMSLYYAEELSMKEIAKNLQISEWVVKHKHGEALTMLRKNMDEYLNKLKLDPS